MSQIQLLKIIKELPTVYLALLILPLIWIFILQIRRRPYLAFIRLTPVIFFVEYLLVIALYATASWFYLRGLVYPTAYLPPHSQFYFQKILDLITSELAGWMAAGVLFAISWYFFIRRSRGELVDIQDLMLMVIGAMAVGWPSVLVYLAIIFVLSVLSLFFLVVIRQKTIHDRLIITYSIIPAALLTLIFRDPLLEVTGLFVIRF